MNYYRRYMGDYTADTAHLSLAEHGALTLLLDWYYSREAPFPATLDLCRLCRAGTREERQAVQRVADEFFPLADGVRRNARADRELGLAQAKIATARENGKLSPGRPKKTDRVTDKVTNEETNGEGGSGTRSEPRENHPPTTNPQPLSTIHQPRAATSAREVGSGKPRLPHRWWESEEGLKAAARTLGLPNPDGKVNESREAFRARINAAIDVQHGGGD